MPRDSRAEIRSLRHVRRVAQDQVELLLDTFGPVADGELRARLEAEPAGVGRGIGKRLPRDVYADSRGIGPEIQRCQQQRSRPRSEVKDALRAFDPFEMLKGGGDQHFAVRTWDKHAGTDVKLNVPKGAAAGDVGDRLAQLAPLDHLEEAIGRVALAIWAYEELARGTNGFRRVLGAVMLVVIVRQLADR